MIDVPSLKSQINLSLESLWVLLIKFKVVPLQISDLTPTPNATFNVPEQVPPIRVVQNNVNKIEKGI